MSGFRSALRELIDTADLTPEVCATLLVSELGRFIARTTHDDDLETMVAHARAAVELAVRTAHAPAASPGAKTARRRLN